MKKWKGDEKIKHSVAYYCEKHNIFSKPKRFYHKFDFQLECEKLMAELECGCSVWVATVERDRNVLDWYKSLEKEGEEQK